MLCMVQSWTNGWIVFSMLFRRLPFPRLLRQRSFDISWWEQLSICYRFYCQGENYIHRTITESWSIRRPCAINRPPYGQGPKISCLCGFLFLPELVGKGLMALMLIVWKAYSGWWFLQVDFQTKGNSCWHLWQLWKILGHLPPFHPINIVFKDFILSSKFHQVLRVGDSYQTIWFIWIVKYRADSCFWPFWTDNFCWQWCLSSL